jgi:hypothetical protein
MPDLPVAIRRAPCARSLGRVTPRWAGGGPPAGVLGPSQSSGPAGPAERRGPAGQSAGQVPGGSWHRAPRRLRQARGTDSKETGEPGRPVAGLGSPFGVSSLAGDRAAAGGGRCRGGGGPGASDGSRHLLHDSARSEQVPPGPCTDAFPAPRAGGPHDPCNTCWAFTP